MLTFILIFHFFSSTIFHRWLPLLLTFATFATSVTCWCRQFQPRITRHRRNFPLAGLLAIQPNLSAIYLQSIVDDINIARGSNWGNVEAETWLRVGINTTNFINSELVISFVISSGLSFLEKVQFVKSLTIFRLNYIHVK